jgi:uncharacterized protein (DUF1778 family)
MGGDHYLFGASPAYQQSGETIAAYERTTLNPEDCAVFFDVLDNPPAPKPELAEAFARHERMVVSK